jgi:two-component system chemotaxis response regulator CheB
VLADPPGLTASPARALPVVALAASAGGLKALIEVLGGLPADFPAALAIVQHMERHGRSLLAGILARRTALQVRQAAPGDALAPGVAFVAPPDHHLLVNRDGTLSLTQTELVHFVRPSADLLFESVAASLGSRAIAVVLSGSGSDGAMGVTAIRKRGGTVIVQDPAQAEHPGMPRAARDTRAAHYVLPLEAIAPALVRLAARPAA